MSGLVVGSLGASRLHEAIAKTKNGWGASRQNLLSAIVLERITGQAQQTYQTQAMLEGIETEPEARNAYAFYFDADVTLTEPIPHPTIAHAHASPDGLVGADGLVEIKCPQPAAHMALLLGEAIPEKYIIQCQWQMACTGRAWNDFVSYNKSFPERLRLWQMRIHRDTARIRDLESAAIAFLAEVDAAVRALGRLVA